jgi:hypothetical protein
MDRNLAYARALGTAFAEDMDNPAVARAIARSGLTKGQFTQIVKRDVARELSGEPGPVLFPNVRAFARQAINITALKKAAVPYGRLMNGLNAVAAPAASSSVSLIGGLASLGGAIAGAVGAIWGTKIQVDAQKSLAKIQLQEAQIVQNSQSIAMKSALIQNATAQGLRADPQTGQPVDPSTGEPLSEIGAAAQAKVGGIPAWGIALSAGAAVVGAAYAFGGGHN